MKFLTFIFIDQNQCYQVSCEFIVKVLLGVCFAQKFVERFTYFTYLITLCKDVTFPLITKF